MLAIRINATTNGSGAATVTRGIQGGGGSMLLYAVEWIDGDFADGVDAVLSCVNTVGGVDRTLLTLTDANNDAIYYPRVLEADNAGGALTTYALPVVDGDLKLAVTSGGDTKTGGCVVHLLEA